MIERKAIEDNLIYERIYQETPTGGAIDMMVDTMWGSGYVLDGEDEALKVKVQEILDRMDFENNARLATREGLKFGPGFHEVVKTNDGLYKLVTRSSINMFPVKDENGDITHWKQVNLKSLSMTDNNVPMVPVDDCIVIIPIPSLVNDTGISLIRRARNATNQYDDICGATVQSIYNNGFPTLDVKITTEDGKDVPDGVPEAVGSSIQDINHTSSLITGPGTELLRSTNGVPQAEQYLHFGLTNLAVAMTMPLSAFGIEENSEATAKIIYGNFYRRMRTIESGIAKTYQEHLLDRRLLPALGARRGDVKIRFMDPDPADMLVKAQTAQVYMTLDPYDPYAIKSKQEIASILGTRVSEDEYQDEERIRQMREGQNANPQV
jgi:hypothetical protein